MRLLVIRHAIAEDKETFAGTGRDDASRPLTDDGKRKMRRAARGLHELLDSIDVLISSPLTRAIETADIVRDVFGIERAEQMPELEPTRPLPEAVASLSRFPGELIALVGHEPQLSRLVTFLISGHDQSGIELKKGGACLIQFDGMPSAAGGVLLWAVKPGTLRKLAG